MVRAIPLGLPSLIGQSLSVFLGYSHWSMNGRSGIKETTLGNRDFLRRSLRFT